MHFWRKAYFENNSQRLITTIAILLLGCSHAAVSPSAPQIAIDLHPQGFPPGLEIKSGAFYLSKDRLGLFFYLSPEDKTHSHAFRLMVLDAKGQITAQIAVHGDPKAIDITAGPNGGVLIGREGKLDFYDSKLQWLRSMALSPATTGIRFDRERNQLIVMTAEQELGHRTAHFLNGTTLEESAAIPYPLKSIAVFGEHQLVYTVTGNCFGSAHIVSDQHSWHSLETLPACDPLAFITTDSLAYAFDAHLFVVDSTGKELLRIPIPAPVTFQAPRLVGLSEDHTRLAIAALKKKTLSSGWPYYDAVFVYDLVSKRIIFKQGLPSDANPLAFSPDGHQLAIISQGSLLLIQVP